MSNKKTTISVLLPTRDRTNILKKSIASLMETADDPSRIEIILGLDSDDVTTLEYLKDDIAAYLKPFGMECKAQVFQPMGYENLHTYVNTLASVATGDWLFFWNDDGIMLTDSWDSNIEKYNGQFKLLAPKDNHNGHPYAIFPIVPADWFKLMDHLSQNAQNDAWLSHIAYMLDIFERVPEIEFLHDRADLTGNNNDETFKRRKYMEGNPSDPADFGHPDMQKERTRTAFKIAWYLEKIGQPSQWWADVMAGKQEPFAKMVSSSGVKGAGQQSAIKNDAESTKPKYSDDDKLVL